MFKFLIISLTLLLPYVPLHAQPGPQCVTTTFYNQLLPETGKKIELRKLQTCPNGDFLLFTNTNRLNEGKTGGIVRMSNAGITLQQKQLLINNQPVTIYDGKVFTNGNIVVAGIMNDGSNNVFLAHLKNDLTVNWASTYTQSSSPLKVTVDVYDKVNISLAIQLHTSVIYQSVSETGVVKWVKNIVITGLTELVGFSNMNWTPLALVTNVLLNNKRSVQIGEIDKVTGNVISSHTLDNGTNESKSLAISSFATRLKIFGVSAKAGEPFKLFRTITYGSAVTEAVQTYEVPGSMDFNITAALDNSADAMGIALPKDGKLIFIRQFADFNTKPDFSREYAIPVGASISSIARSFDGGFLFGLNTLDADSLILIKTDSIGILAGCGYADGTTTFSERYAQANFAAPISLSAISPVVNATTGGYVNSNFTSRFSCNERYCPPPPIEDTCFTSYLKLLRSHSYIDMFGKYLLMRNNQHLVSTSRYDRVLGEGNQVTGGLKMFTESGNFKKGVSIYLDQSPTHAAISKMTDSTFITTLYSAPNNKPTYTFSLVTDDLDILWTTSVQISRSLIATDLCMDAAGNVYFAGITMGFFEDPSVVVYKMDANGKSAWLKTYAIASGGHFGQVKIVATGASLVLVVQGSPFVSVLMNKNSGAMISSYKFQLTESGSSSHRLLKLEQNRIYYAGDYQSNQFMMAVFDTLAKPVRISALNAYSPIRAAEFKDGHFYGNFETYNGTKSINVLLKADTALNLVYQNEYDQISWGISSGLGVSKEGNIYVGGNYLYRNNYFNAYLGKYSNDGKIGSCDFTPGTLTLMNIDPGVVAVSSYSRADTYQTVDIPVYFYQDDHALQVSNLLCSSAPECGFIDIDGPQRSCTLNKDYSFTITKRPGCTKIPLWKFDTASATLVQVTETTAVFRFKKAGLIQLKAIINAGCGYYADSLVVLSSDAPASPVNLGKDTLLCAGNEITLQAGQGYSSYTWQDGSTNADFLVRNPGQYSIVVNDGCNNVYRDTIIVSDYPSIPFTPLTDRFKCDEDTLQLQADRGFISYSWSPAYRINSVSGRSVIINPSTDTSYYMKAEKFPGCFIYDTVRVTVHKTAAINLGKDTSFCEGQSLLLDAGPGFIRYSWNEQSTNRQLTVSHAGDYIVKGSTIEGCVVTDTMSILQVFKKPVLNLNKSPELCEGSSRVLNAGGFSTYKWQDGSTGRTFRVEDIGTYHVQVTDEHQCSASDTTVISAILPSPKDFLPADTSICSYGKLTLQPTASFSKYLWSTGSVSSLAQISAPGTYWLEATNEKNCTGRDVINVELKHCMKGLYVPNAFTPATDGKNDVFRAMLFGAYKYFSFSVYNRWGTLVFHTTNPTKGWDGKLNGLPQDPNVFVWVCNYQLEGEVGKSEKGTVVLVR